MSNSEDRETIKLISESYVKPKHYVKGSEESLYLGPVNLILCNNYCQIEKGLLYAAKTKNGECDKVERLKNAMSIALVDFYPLAGQLETKVYPEEGTKLVYLDCNKGPGARLLHARIDRLGVSHFSSFSEVDGGHHQHPTIRYLFEIGEGPFYNHQGDVRPLLTIQVTELVDGIFISFILNHSVVDGTSTWKFINALSEIFLNLDDHQFKLSKPPIILPTFFPDGFGPIIKFPNKIHRPPFKNQASLRRRKFHLSSDSVSRLKAKANEECGVYNISSFQASSAFLWRSITRARNLGHDEETTFVFMVNARARLNPPFPDEYFGALITSSETTCNAGELLSNGFGWAALLIQQAVARQDDKGIRKVYETYGKLLCDDNSNAYDYFDSPNSVTILGSSRFNTYGPDFGLGKPTALLSGKLEDGEAFANPGICGYGNLDFTVCLTTEIMNVLESDDEFMSFVTTS